MRKTSTSLRSMKKKKKKKRPPSSHSMSLFLFLVSLIRSILCFKSLICYFLMEVLRYVTPLIE